MLLIPVVLWYQILSPIVNLWGVNIDLEYTRSWVEKKMLRRLKYIVLDKKIDIGAILEPRINGRAANHYILQIGFGRSFQVEVHVWGGRGGGGGIWLLWNDTGILRLQLR